ncbi:MAG: hypothetical protein HN909_04605 [Phycisphaerales bacterium]|jgi:hypothetical protein|nr:hypothetical protein [Phycisphaerales bacterium]MBT7171032.1 hypothetical protein [Phycisphaerales bacterium]
MIAWSLSPAQKFLLIVLAASWLWTAIRTGWMAKRRGRRQWLWTLITICCSALVAVVVFWWDDSQNVEATDLPSVRRRKRRRGELDEDDES